MNAALNNNESMRRPATVTFLGILLVLGGAGSIVSFIFTISGSNDISIWLKVGWLLLGGLYLICAWGLFHLRHWGRWMQIGISILGLYAFPFGTIFSIVILIYFFLPRIKILFSDKAADELSDSERTILEQGVRPKTTEWALSKLIPFAFLLLILGSVLYVSLPNLFSAVNRGKQARTMADLKTISYTLESYKKSHSSYPDVTTLNELNSILVPQFATKLPSKDGWNRDIRYFAWKENSDASGPDRFALASGGRDGKWEQERLDRYQQGSISSFDEDLVIGNEGWIRQPKRLARPSALPKPTETKSK